MIPVTQTRTGKNGNCFAACLASIFEIPIQSVPEFTDDGDLWLRQLAAWLDTFDLMYVQLEVDDPIVRIMFEAGLCFHTIEGISPRGGPHACVGLNGEIAWDPHPQDGTQHGLKKVQVYGFLVSRNVSSPI